MKYSDLVSTSGLDSELNFAAAFCCYSGFESHDEYHFSFGFGLAFGSVCSIDSCYTYIILIRLLILVLVLILELVLLRIWF